MATEPGGAERLTKPGRAAEVAKTATLEDPAKALLRPEQSPKDYLDALTKAGLHADAVRFMAALLDKREAVWWAAKCVRQVPPLAEGEKLVAALAAAEKWATDPSDDNRRASFAAAEAAEMSTPAGCAAVAAFFSDGSLAPAHLQGVPPPPGAGAATASSAIILAAVTIEPQKAPERYAKFLALGTAVASGENRWPGGPPAATAAGAAPRPGVKSPPPPPPAKGWY